MKRFVVVICAITLACWLMSVSGFGQEANEQKALKFTVGMKYFGGQWDFRSSNVWNRGITGRIDMTTLWGMAGPFGEISMAKDHLGISGHYLVGHFHGDYQSTDKKHPDEMVSTEDGSMWARREEFQLMLRLTPYQKYISILMGYKWLKYYNFERRGHGVEIDYPDDPYSRQVLTYDVTDRERNRIHGFQYGIGLTSPELSGFYAWGVGLLLPNLNIKYARNWERRYDLASAGHKRSHKCLAGRMRGFSTKMGIGYIFKETPVKLKLGWWLQIIKPDEPDTQKLVWNERFSGALFSLSYQF